MIYLTFLCSSYLRPLHPFLSESTAPPLPPPCPCLSFHLPVSESSHRVRGLRKTSCQSWTCHNNAAPVRVCVCLCVYLCEYMCMQLSWSVCHQEKGGNISKSYCKYKDTQTIHIYMCLWVCVCAALAAVAFSRSCSAALLIGCLALWQEMRWQVSTPAWPQPQRATLMIWARLPGSCAATGSSLGSDLINSTPISLSYCTDKTDTPPVCVFQIK